MSFDQLMDHARQIEELATRWAVVMSKEGLGDQAPPAVDQVRPDSPTYGADYQRFQAQFAFVPTLFEPFASCPDPALFTPLIHDVDDVLKRLSFGAGAVDPFTGYSYGANSDLEKMTGASSALEGWTGRAAMNFKETFIDPFRSIEGNQFLLAQALKCTLEAEQAIWVATRRDIDDIAHKTLAALDHMQDCGRNTWGQTFTVAACLTSLVAAPFSGGLSLALDLVGAAAWVAAASPPSSAPTIEFSGETPQAVLASMSDAVGRLGQDIRSQRDRIDRCLAAARLELSQNGRQYTFPRPELAGSPPSTLTGPFGLGYVQ